MMSVGANPSTTLWSFTGMARAELRSLRPEGLKNEAQRAERGGVLGKGMFSSSRAMGSGGAL